MVIWSISTQVNYLKILACPFSSPFLNTILQNETLNETQGLITVIENFRCEYFFHLKFKQRRANTVISKKDSISMRFEPIQGFQGPTLFRSHLKSFCSHLSNFPVTFYRMLLLTFRCACQNFSTRLIINKHQIIIQME